LRTVEEHVEFSQLDTRHARQWLNVIANQVASQPFLPRQDSLFITVTGNALLPEIAAGQGRGKCASTHIHHQVAWIGKGPNEGLDLG
jgi:hypothetical protein